MADKQIQKCDFENKYPVSEDIVPEKVKFERTENGYRVSYSDEREFKRDGVTGRTSKSFCFSQSFGRGVKEADMEVKGGEIRIRGLFEPKVSKKQE
jgi:hypothetical protein